MLKSSNKYIQDFISKNWGFVLDKEQQFVYFMFCKMAEEADSRNVNLSDSKLEMLCRPVMSKRVAKRRRDELIEFNLISRIQNGLKNVCNSIYRLEELQNADLSLFENHLFFEPSGSVEVIPKEKKEVTRQELAELLGDVPAFKKLNVSPQNVINALFAQNDMFKGKEEYIHTVLSDLVKYKFDAAIQSPLKYLVAILRSPEQFTSNLKLEEEQREVEKKKAEEHARKRQEAELEMSKNKVEVDNLSEMQRKIEELKAKQGEGKRLRY